MLQNMDLRQGAGRHGLGLAVLIDDQVHTVVGLSVDGVAFQCRGLAVGDQTALRLARLTDLADAADARVTVTGVSGSVVHAAFHANLNLIRYVLRKTNTPL